MPPVLPIAIAIRVMTLIVGVVIHLPLQSLLLVPPHNNSVRKRHGSQSVAHCVRDCEGTAFAAAPRVRRRYRSAVIDRDGYDLQSVAIRYVVGAGAAA
jgi:hypothetical protein